MPLIQSAEEQSFYICKVCGEPGKLRHGGYVQLDVSVGMIAEVIGRKAPGVRKHPDASSLQNELRRIYRIWVGFVDLYAGDKTHARIFLNAPNRNLDNHAPIEFIESGNLQPLELFVDALNARQPV